MRRLSRTRFAGHIVVSVIAVAAATLVTFESIPQTPPMPVSLSAVKPCQADIALKKVAGGHRITVCGFQFVYPGPWIIKSFRSVENGATSIRSVFRDSKDAVRAHLRCPMSDNPPEGACTIHTRTITGNSQDFFVDLVDCTQPEKASNGKPMGETRSVVVRIHAAHPSPDSPSCEIFPEVWEYNFSTALTNITNIYKTVGLGE